VRETKSYWEINDSAGDAHNCNMLPVAAESVLQRAASARKKASGEKGLHCVQGVTRISIIFIYLLTSEMKNKICNDFFLKKI
jgi:hypothetical protein